MDDVYIVVGFDPSPSISTTSKNKKWEVRVWDADTLEPRPALTCKAEWR